MAAVYGIVTNHSGGITVASQPGQGTRVHLFLPAFGKQEPAEAGIIQEQATGPGKGTVLLIEDEADVMEITHASLKRLGYTVIEAATGEEAIQKVHTEPIDVALLDIKLPDMGGAQVYPLLMEARPELKVIVFSGYSLDSPAREILDAGANGFIQKPFSIKGLAEKMKEVLEK
jgi:CheY-like chemotaxis protein